MAKNLTPKRTIDYQIYCGAASDVLQELRAASVDTVMYSPPYFGLRKGAGYEGEIGNETNVQEYLDNLMEVVHQIDRVLKSTGSIWINIADKYYKGSKMLIPEQLVLRMTREAGLLLRNQIVWAKTSYSARDVRRRFQDSWEGIYWFTKSMDYWFEKQWIPRTTDPVACVRKIVRRRKEGAFQHLKNERLRTDSFTAGLHGRLIEEEILDASLRGKPMPDVWRIKCAQDYGDHPATYPEELCRVPILSTCPIGGTVLDPFCGSGTTGRMALDLGRSFIGIEIRPDYAFMAARSLQALMEEGA